MPRRVESGESLWSLQHQRGGASAPRRAPIAHAAAHPAPCVARSSSEPGGHEPADSGPAGREIVDNVAVAANSGGKRAGARRATPPKRRFRPSILAYAVAITALVIGWGYLVWAAIDFGGDARDGDSRAWGFLGLAALGAAACLFAGLMLLARLLRALGGASVVPAPRSPASPTMETAAHGPRALGSVDGSAATTLAVGGRGGETGSILGPGGPPINGHLRRTPATRTHGRTPSGSHRHRAG